jgi:hypothetical protein
MKNNNRMTPLSFDTVLLHLEGLPDIKAIPSPGRKKTMSLSLDDDGRITVRFPARMNPQRARHFVSSKKEWPKKKLDAWRRDALADTPRDFTDGKPIPYLGQYFPLRLSTPREPQHHEITFTGQEFVLPGHLRDSAGHHISSWYKKAAQRILEPSVNHYCSVMNVKPAAVRISGAKRRWGSCSAKNALNFSWRIAILPQDLIDYIVVHELAHLKHKNHGPLFWNTVSGVIDDTKAKNLALKNHSGRFLT